MYSFLNHPACNAVKKRAGKNKMLLDIACHHGSHPGNGSCSVANTTQVQKLTLGEKSPPFCCCSAFLFNTSNVYANLQIGKHKHNHIKWKVKSLSCVQLFVTPRTVAYHAPPSKGFSRREYWCGLPFPSPGGLPDPGISHIVGRYFTIWATREVHHVITQSKHIRSHACRTGEIGFADPSHTRTSIPAHQAVQAIHPIVCKRTERCG